MVFSMRSMARFSAVQKQLLQVVEALVRAVVEELCELEDVSVLKVRYGAEASEHREAAAGLQQDSTAIRFTVALERLTKNTVDQLSQLFCRLTQAKAPLSYLKRQKRRRNRLSVEAQLAKRRSSEWLRSSEVHIHTTATDKTNEDEGQGELDLLSQTETVSGEMNPLYFSSEDTAENISEEVFPQEVEVQQETMFKVELEHEQEQVECSMQHCDQQEEAIHNQEESAVKPISKMEDGTQNACSQPISSETLEIKISAAQSFDVGHAQETSARRHPGRSLSEGGTRKKATARNLIQCDACDKTFTYLNNLKRHQKTFHSGETPHACQDCGERFGSKRLLRVHLREHRVEKPHACKLCEKVFRLPNHLKKHMTSHTNERPFICSTCGKTFALVSTLRAHEKTHSDEKTFVCTECGMSFLTKSYLDYHQRVHTGEKPYTCMHCGKTFAQKSNLRVHERLHTGEKPFHCDDCGESFIHANSFKSHRQLHTGMKAFCCEHCGKGFRRGTHLKTHLLTHTGVKPFQCDLCPKRFALKGSLKAHRLTHTGEKSFVCNICNKTFTQASSLGKHKRTHTGEKPYLCTFCSKSFCQSSHLHYHYRAFHPGQTS